MKRPSLKHLALVAAAALIVGVGGVASYWDAVELVLAGASAVQVGTASFADPGAAGTIQDGLIEWAASRGLTRLADLAAIG